MVDPAERPEAEPRRDADRPEEQRTMEGRPVEDLTTPSEDEGHEKHGTGPLKFLGLELGMFATAVILAVIFVAAIIFFAMTR